MRYLATLMSLALIALPTFASERRDADAHVHGISLLHIAIDGSVLALEFEAPGMDLVGFEHAPKTDAQHQSIEDAMTALNAPEALFGLPDTAQCARTQTTVHGPTHEAEHSEAKDHEHGTPHGHDTKHTETQADTHSEFHAVYAWSCKEIDALHMLTPTLLTRFPRMQTITVMYATPKGQGTLEVTTSTPSVRLP